MGYRKIVQYGDTTEIYDYEKNIRQRKGINAKKARILMLPRENHANELSVSSSTKRKKLQRLQRKAKGTHRRSKRSITRSKTNFFRLTHHNNCLAETIHFVTLTFAYDLTYKKALSHLNSFMEKVQRLKPEISLSYISVPELTKKGRYHFHLLVYDLPSETAQRERETRNFQRLFERGYVDICLATYTSEGIAGYMAKYMAKALTDEKNEATRGFSTSRNIEKVRTAGSNTLDSYSDLIIPTDSIVKEEHSQYDVPYLGLCRFKKIIVRNI